MASIFDAYNWPVERLSEFYRRLTQTISYPDGMTTSLGIIYWGRDEHRSEIERAIPRLVEHGTPRFDALLQATRTPARSARFAEQTGIPPAILRLLKHDIELWLPLPVPLGGFEWFRDKPDCLHACANIGLADQLAVISAGQTPEGRAHIADQISLNRAVVDEMVKLCDHYRSGKNLEHIRAKIYYAIGMDTLEKWAAASSESIIARFTEFTAEQGLAGERLIPWPKEVRNGIEWARLHLEVYKIQW